MDMTLRMPRRCGLRTLALVLSLFAIRLRPSAQEAAGPTTRTHQAERAVVQLLAIGPGAGEKKLECAATGFFVNADGYILTNAHVVNDARRCLASSAGAKILAKFSGNNSGTAQAVACDIVAMDEDHDLAILKTELPLPPEMRGAFLRLDTRPVPDGTCVAVTGHPAFVWQPKTFQGKVIGRQVFSLNERSRHQTDLLVVNIPLQQGASGSPVWRDSGGVVGIVERRRHGQPCETLAVPVSYAIQLLELRKVPWKAAE